METTVRQVQESKGPGNKALETRVDGVEVTRDP